MANFPAVSFLGCNLYGDLREMLRKREERPPKRTPFCDWPIAFYLLVWEVPVASSNAAWAAARRAVSRRKGEQET